MAQLVARLVRNEKVRGSNPLSSTKQTIRPGNQVGFFVAQRQLGGASFNCLLLGL